MRRIFILLFILSATVVYVAVGGKGERVYYPDVGSLEYINDAKICAIYYRLIGGKDDDDGRADLSAFEAVYWEQKNKILGISMGVAMVRIEEEIEKHINKIDDPELRQNAGVRKIILQGLANNRGCPRIVISGQINLISEVNAGSK